MNPTERIIATIEGKEVDRVQTFGYYLDNYPVEQLLGKSFMASSFLLMNPLTSFFFDRLNYFARRSYMPGQKGIDPKKRKHASKAILGLKKVMLDPVVDAMMMKSIEAAITLGFDSVMGLFEGNFMFWDSKTLARVTGSFYDLVDDGHGNAFYMYRGPAFLTAKDFDAWPYFPDTDDFAQKTYKFFRKAQKKFGEKTCILGQAAFGIHETILWSLGFEKMAIFVRREPQMIKRFIAYLEELIMKTNMAMMDAGIRIIFNGDDFAYKTGPMMNPKVVDELFGPSYRRITKAVHDRDGKVLLHSCGDNTKLFDLFIDWGFDGGHAYENTSNVDIEYEKKTHGDRFTIVGGVGVDYMLTHRSKQEEVEEEVKRLIKVCGPGGRFLLGPVHDHPDMDMDKVKLMIKTVKEYGRYPIEV